MRMPHHSLRLVLIAAAAVGQFRLEAATPSYPRVEYLRTVPSVREFTKPRGFFSKMITWIAGWADDKPELLRPYATTHDSTGRLLVADPGQHGVHIYYFEKHKYLFLRGPRGKALESARARRREPRQGACRDPLLPGP